MARFRKRRFRGRPGRRSFKSRRRGRGTRSRRFYTASRGGIRI